MLIRLASLIYALGILFFYPHPIIAARTPYLLVLWGIVALYTAGLIVILVVRADAWLRSAPFIIADTFFAIVIVNLAGGGYRNIFSLYSLTPTVTALRRGGHRVDFGIRRISISRRLHAAGDH
jgi:hypothetical protein